MKKIGIVSAFIFSLPVTVMAGNLSVPAAFDNAKVLPKGIRNLRFNQIYAEANDKFSSNGTTVTVGNALNVDVTYNKLINGQNSALERGILEGYLTRQGKDLEAIAGQTTGVVNVEVDAKVPVMAVGLTRSWTAAIVVPVVTTRTNIDTGFIAGSGFQGIANQLIAEGKQFKAEDVQSKSLNAIANKVAKYGYTPMSSEEKDMLGDIRLVNKIQISKKRSHAFAITAGITLPTGEEASIDKVVDPAAGDGQTDYEVGAIADIYMTSKMTVSARASYTLQSGDNTAKRIPEVSDSSLTPDIDPEVSRKLGNMFYSSFGLNYQTDIGLVIKSQYSFQYKGEDVYTGSKFAAERYGWMSKDTEQKLHAVQLAVGYSTIPAFKRKEFAVPMELNLTLGAPLSGQNVTKDSSVVAEMAIFF
ncbi:MAG: hypothetical protein HN576_05830 [Bacteriovoracaceae bacterium]|nr:hypothetical protein [Bacteriovoracaceae bacterium]